MKNIYHLLFTLVFALCLVTTNEVNAQVTDASDFGKNAEIKPKVGLGAGIFTYFGDVHDNNYSHLFTSSIGYELMFARNLAPSFDIELKVVMGNLTINERSLERNLNFSSDIFNGSANLVYNFNNLYKRPKMLQPFVSVGIAYLHFDSKTDLYDANGVKYNYWSDGSIRSLPEDDELAESAEILQRDYEFETDLRKMNLDSLGKYSQSSLSIPFSGGVNFRVSPRVNFRLGTTFYYNFTDLVDNISDAGNGVRLGDSKNDLLLYTHAALTYNLWKEDFSAGSGSDQYYDQYNFDLLFTEDSDGDGVIDFSDECQGTPKGIPVDYKGCPFDHDDDGIRETDEEENSALKAVVNTKGVTYTDSMRLAEIADSLAVPRDKIDVIYPGGVLEPQRSEEELKALRTAELEKLGPTDDATEVSDDAIEVNVTEKDMDNLIQKASQLQEELINSKKMDEAFDDLSKTIIENNIQTPEQIDSVVRANKLVYDELSKGNDNTSQQSSVVVKEQKEKVSIIPKKFQATDLNKDELIGPDEVLMIIEKFLDGDETFSLEEIYDLVDYYEENMKGARVINFGGKKGVYINGELNILPVLDSGPANPKQSFLATKFKSVDLDKDGVITPDEVNSVIKLYEAGSELYTKEMILELIDLYFED